ncbi:hypothetical protein FOPG_17852 [Fusarium oxysporum f. sp. conglutinans race 2 54008]|uniref:VIT domain-containing protein n=1 Tax=Fusarium oxysporum f. sp. conglutinans race 2 54008 TaxID=1089457 RepID=X0H1K4_FUSOX|nr:hypothetical protein FOPG_17852 [Fusarium oxysporum f. sp. conglutinans race 2 54008]
MPFALPGIRYDAREPPPPGCDLGHVDAQYMSVNHNGREPFDVLPHWNHHGRANAPRQRRWDVGGAVEVGNYDHEPYKEDFLPPLSTSVRAQIIHDTAKFTVTQVFENQSQGIRQGVYQFLLPLEATVTGFECRIGPNKIVRGTVKARKDARYKFDKARHQGRTGGLMEQQTAEIFTITLANIPSRTKMQSELSFMCFLKHRVETDRQVFTLTLPTFIAPRYGDAPPGIRISTQDSHFLSLDVDILTTEDLLSVESKTHAIRYTMGAGPRNCQTWNEFIAGHDDDTTSPKAATIELEHRLTSLDKDLVITINTVLSDNAEAPQACLEMHPTLGNHQALMVTLPPELMEASVNSTNHGGEIIFLADRSGSMVDKIDSLKSAMMFFINGIPENQPFNIWCFGSDYTCLWPQSRRLDEASRQEAIAYVFNEFKSDMGGTAILPALEEICNAMGEYPTMDVIVLTDGQVWSAPETIGFVKGRRVISRGAARFFSLGIGDAVSHELVEGIAKAGGGYAEVIPSASGGGWEDRVVAVLKAATTSHVGSLSLRLEWHERNNLGPPSSFKQSPFDVSNLSPFLRNRIFLMFDSGEQHPELKHVVVQVQSPTGRITNKIIVPKRLFQPDTFIHKLAARALLGDLERREGCLGFGKRSVAEDPVIRAEAIDLGCKWSLVSRWTSIYAVEEETAAPNEQLRMEMEIVEAADELNDALLERRGGRAIANPRPRLPHTGAAADESGSKSDYMESSLGTCTAGQSVTGNNSDDDSDDDPNNPGFNSNSGQCTDPGSGTESPNHRQANQPGESQAYPSMYCIVDALQPGGELPSDVTIYSNGWNPTPRYEHDASSGSQIHSPPVSLKGRSLDRPRLRQMRSIPRSIGKKREKWGDSDDETTRPSKTIKGISRSNISDLSAPSSRRSTCSRVLSSDVAMSPMPQATAYMIAPSPRSVESYSADLLQAAPSLPSNGVLGNSSLQTNIGTGEASGSGLISDGETSGLPNCSNWSDNDSSLGQYVQASSSPSHPREAPFLAFPPPEVYNSHQSVPGPSSFRSSSTFEAASAPIFNPPGSTSLLWNVRAAKSADELAAEQFIRQLVLVQLSDGRFSFSDDHSVKTTMGLPFLCLVTSMRSKLNYLDPVVTIAIVALLEEQFQCCQDLWALMVRKAADYITGCNLGTILEELQLKARQGVRSMGSVLKDVQDSMVVIDTSTELLSAPNS